MHAKFIVLLGLSSVLLFGCDKPANQAKAPAIVLFVGKTFGNPYFVEMGDGVKSAAISNHISPMLRAGAAEDDVRGQTIILESFLSTSGAGQRGIVLAPATSGADFNDIIASANKASIPVVVLDTAIPDSVLGPNTHVLSTIASDNYGGGVSAGHFMASKVPHCGTILLLVGVPQQVTAIDRKQGFENGLAAGGKDRACTFPVVERVANWNRDEARRVVGAMVPVEQSIVGIFGSNDQMALGAVEAIEQAPGNQKRPVIVGFDAAPEAVTAINAGRMDATMRQQPAMMGTEAIEAIIAAWAGRTVPAKSLIPVALVTASAKK